MRYALLLSILLGQFFSGLIALASVPMDLPIRYEHYHVKYVLHDDATLIESREWSRTVLKQSAIDSVKHASVSYSTSVQKAEIVEAYTRKADGRRIDVPKANYQVKINKGDDPTAPVFSDFSSVSLVFPDVAVGDTVVFSSRIIQSEAIFPNHFTAAELFSRQMAFDNARVEVEYPEGMWVQYAAREMQEKVSSPAPGRKLVEWTYTNPQPVKSERRDYSAMDPDKEPGVSFSTFRNYQEIAAAYGARALPKAQVTDRIKELAGQIVGDKTAPRDQAQALYEWVAETLTYGGNCVGVGTVVPRELSFVLDNKMGDCKDHATLLQALLAARGIDSTQALVNARSIYTLPKIPVVSQFNHVINYIPAFDLFLDATSKEAPFGILPPSVRGKVAFLAGKDNEQRRIPTPARATEQKVVSKLKIAEDGSLSGTVEAFLKGDAAISLRQWARDLPKEKEEDFIKDLFRSAGLVATGRLLKDDPAGLSDTYHYILQIDRAEKYVRFPGSGAFYLYPPGGMMAIDAHVDPGMDQKIDYDVACSNGLFQESYEIELPDAMNVLSIPNAMEVQSSVQSYQAHYALQGKKLVASRVFADSTSTSLCAPEISAEYSKLGGPVKENLQEQVLYKKY